jgi:group I intron endonuclease
VNNKIYVGVHKTKNINDGYMGSGKVIKDAICKYGIDNFKKDILEFFDDSESMYARESEVVTEEFLLRDDVYNLRRGGFGGFTYINSELTEQMKNVRATNTKNIPVELKSLGGKISGSKNLSKAHKENKVRYDTFTGKTHSKETKQKMKQSAIGKHMGNKNSQYGTMWITDGINNSKVCKDSIIPNGWYRGRKMK